MIDAAPITIPDVAHFFPRLNSNEVNRDNLLDVIDTSLESNDIVVIEGSEGIGKTTVAAQFARRHPSLSLSIFASSPLSTDLGVLRADLATQLSFALGETEPQTDVEQARLNFLFFELSRYARKRHNKYNIIVDGIDTASSIADVVLDSLPFGTAAFKFVICTQNRARYAFMASAATCVVPGFTIDETRRFLSDTALTTSICDEVHRLLRGIPDRLASFRRLIRQGVDPELLLSQPFTTAPELLEKEWSPAEALGEDGRKLLALLAFDNVQHTFDSLIRTTGVERPRVAEIIKRLPFLVTDDDGTISFVAEPLRAFAKAKLREFRNEVTELVIAELLRDPDGDVALRRLPDYLEQAGRLDLLLSYLTSERFAHLLQKTQSLAFVKERSAAAIRAANATGNDNELLRVTLQRASLLDFDRAGSLRLEVAARVAVGDYEIALKLAQDAVLKEDRLQLLALIARGKREAGLAPEPAIVELVNALASEVDATTLGERAISIGEDLIYVNPELAVQFLEGAKNAGAIRGPEFDLAVSQASLQASLGQSASSGELDSLYDLIADQRIRRFSSQAHLLVSSSADELLQAFSDLDRPEDRLFFMKLWTRRRTEPSGTDLVIRAALDLLITTTDYVPTATDLRELATPLQYIEDNQIVRALIVRFDAQADALEAVGPTIDFVRLRLLLALACFKDAPDEARRRFLDTYYYVMDLSATAERGASLAWLLKTLPQVDPSGDFDRHEQISSVVELDLRQLVNTLLAGTADHEVAVRPIIMALAKTRIDLAKEIVLSLNTEPRRDTALYRLVEAAVDRRPIDLELDRFSELLDAFADPHARDLALGVILQRLSGDAVAFRERIQVVYPLLDRIEGIGDGVERCRTLAYAITLLSDDERLAVRLQNAVERLRESWTQLDDPWRKFAVAYDVVPILRPTHLEEAKAFLKRADELRSATPVHDEDIGEVLAATVRLAIRAFRGMVEARVDRVGDLERVIELIDVLPSLEERVSLVSAIALGYVRAQRTDEARQVVGTHVRPLLGRGLKADSKYRGQLVVASFPALYAVNKTIALDYLNTVDVFTKRQALSGLARYIVSKLPDDEPYEYSSGQKLTFDDARELLEVASLMDDDGGVYASIREAAAAARSDRLTYQQRQDLLARIDLLIKDKLPNPRFIRHEGYVLLAKAETLRSRNARGAEWKALATAARQIPNIADRSFVLAGIAGLLPRREMDLCETLATEALTVAEGIPTLFDRAEHYYWLASSLAETMPPFSRRALREAAKAITAESDHANLLLRRQIVDLAYNFEPEFARTVAAIMDSDPGRYGRHETKRRMAALQLKRQLLDSRLQVEGEPDVNACAQSAWMLLKSLNTDRIVSERLENMRGLLRIAGDAALMDGYPIFALAIQSNIRKYVKTVQAATALRPIFDATITAAEFAVRFAELLAKRQAPVSRFGESPSGVFVIRPGERDSALRWIARWMSESLGDYLKIGDPYFGVQDLELVKLIAEIRPGCRINIVTSKKHQLNDLRKFGSDTIEDGFRTYWSKELSDQIPPPTEILVVGDEVNGEAPIHDRWWITTNGGLRVGSSFNGLGRSKLSEISVLSPYEAEQLERELDAYWSRMRRESNGRRLQFSQFSL